MSRTAFICLVLVLLMILGGVLFWFLDEAGSDRLSSGKESPQSEGGGGQARRDIEAETMDRSGAPSQTSQIDTGTSSDDAAKDTKGESLLLRCLDQASREPVAGLDVHVWSRGALKDMGSSNHFVTADVMSRFTMIGTTDESGTLRVAAPAYPFFLGACSKKLVGHADVWSAPEGGEVLLELRPRRSVTVRVVDAWGEPATEAAVQLIQLRLDARMSDMLLHETAVSPETGVAEVPLDALDRLQRSSGGYALRLAGLFHPRVEAPLDPDALPSEPIVLRMPAAASVKVTTRFSEGEESEARGTSLCLSAATETLQDEFSARRFLVEGAARFVPVALGRRLTLTATPEPGSIHLRRSIEFDGPAQSGEEVEVLVDFSTGPQRHFVTGRLLDIEGRPAANRYSMYTLRFRGGAATASGTKTDDDGRFRLSAPETVTEPSVESLVFDLQDAGREPCAARFDAEPESPGTFDVGDLRCRAMPLVASGRVIDDQARPVVGARLSLGGEAGLIMMRVGQVNEGSAQTAVDGSFKLYKFGAPDEFEIEVEAQGHARTKISVLRGAKDLVVRLEGRARVRGRFIVEDPEILRQCRLLQVKNDASRTQLGAMSLASDGSFDLSLPPADLLLQLQFGGNEAEVVWASDILKAGSGAQIDLGDIALALDARPVTFHFIYPPRATRELDASRRSREQGMIAFLDEDGRATLSPRNFASEQVECRVFVKSLPATAEIRLPDFRTERVEVNGPDVTLRLRAGLAVDFEIAGQEAIPAGFAAELRWRVNDADAGLKSRGDFRLDGQASRRVLLPMPGKVEVSLYVCEADTMRRSHGVWAKEALDRCEFVVNDQDSPQTIRVSLDPAILREKAVELK